MKSSYSKRDGIGLDPSVYLMTTLFGKRYLTEADEVHRRIAGPDEPRLATTVCGHLSVSLADAVIVGKISSRENTMNAKQKNTILAAGIVSGLVSLPMTWMTIRNAEMQIEGGFGNLFNSAFQGMTFDVTGLNGHVTLLFKTPLWFVVAVAIAANVLQLMRSSDAFAIPKIALWIVAIGAAIWITTPIGLALSSGKATLGIGWFLGLACASAPLVCLFMPDTEMGRAEHNANDTNER
ncbi:hypothetical protein Q31b_54830 [Novipirellula aureliae]|uniref:Uncharacterized protein n=1 Tax=Novipirellula aureliae TaxID=2527966 RepID=A0A5C6DHZ3_9BACT|nr:hypothetical protein [Novipirellula aureliae]TWU34529.1 hypothetical protein Q31b_54830 [Novipirellula aureliae]